MSGDRAPIDAATRGRLRAWKQKATARQRRIEAVLDNQPFARLCSDFALKKGVGRERAFARPKGFLCETHLHVAVMRPPLAVWAYLRADSSIIVPGSGFTLALARQRPGARDHNRPAEEERRGIRWRFVWLLAFRDPRPRARSAPAARSRRRCRSGPMGSA